MITAIVLIIGFATGFLVGAIVGCALEVRDQEEMEERKNAFYGR